MTKHSKQKSNRGVAEAVEVTVKFEVVLEGQRTTSRWDMRRRAEGEPDFNPELLSPSKFGAQLTCRC